MGVWVRGALAAGVVVCSVAAAGCSTATIAGTPLVTSPARWKRPASFTPRLRCVGPVQP